MDLSTVLRSGRDDTEVKRIWSGEQRAGQGDICRRFVAIAEGDQVDSRCVMASRMRGRERQGDLCGFPLVRE
jgi:hypothetical protein